MADLRISVDQYQFIRSVCLDLLKEPVTVPCGHSYCMSCITGNLQLSRVQKDLHAETWFRQECDDCWNGGETNEDWTSRCCSCWSCRREVWRLYWTVKSCLVCLNSSFILMNDTVIDATRRLKQRICQKHEKVLEVFCRTDKHCICVLCTLDEHRNHETVSAAEEMTQMQVWSDIWYYTYFRSPVQSRIDAFL